jgi:ribonuclease HII
MALRGAELARYEIRLRGAGFARIAGVDEVGRGALAGPLVAAAVILPAGLELDGLADSKLLTRGQRERWHDRIRAEAVAVAVCRVTPDVIDRRGLHRCNLSLLRRAVLALETVPDYVLTDGFPVRRLPMPALAMKKGDAVSASVAAASVVAKVVRDRAMDRYHRRYPEFGFDHNKGYGTPEHWRTLERLGPSPIHRLSFRGVGQSSLFDPAGPAVVGSWDDGSR